jgi:hypothetical protein
MGTATIDNIETPADLGTGYVAGPFDAPMPMLDVDSVPQTASQLAPAGGRCPIGYKLFILLNAVLFVRPAELVPDWENLPIFQCIIIACLIASWPVILPQLKWSSLKKNPITLCVIGLLPAIMLSHLSHRDTYYARTGAIEFSKVIAYYLLLVGLIDSPRRLRSFLLVIAGFVLVTAILSLMNHFGLIQIEALEDLLEGYDDNLPPDQQTGVIVRIRAMGIFNDPNDFCLILNAAAFICLHWLLKERNWFYKFLWALPIALSLYAVALTQSRGGFLATLAGVVVLVFTRLSRKKAIALSVLLLPAIFILFAGRSTDIDVDNKNDTAQGRIIIWRDAMMVFHRNWTFGLGENMLPDEIGHVAHNSYVHGYAELGFFGGTIFVGAFYLSMLGLARLRPKKAPDLSPELASLRLCLLPVLAEYMMGMYSLSRNYIDTTYLVLGVVAAYLVLARGAGFQLPALNWRLARNVVLASIGCVLYFELFVRVMAH